MRVARDLYCRGLRGISGEFRGLGGASGVGCRNILFYESKRVCKWHKVSLHASDRLQGRCSRCTTQVPAALCGCIVRLSSWQGHCC